MTVAPNKQTPYLSQELGRHPSTYERSKVRMRPNCRSVWRLWRRCWRFLDAPGLASAVLFGCVQLRQATPRQPKAVVENVHECPVDLHAFTHERTHGTLHALFYGVRILAMYRSRVGQSIIFGNVDELDRVVCTTGIGCIRTSELVPGDVVASLVRRI